MKVLVTGGTNGMGKGVAKTLAGIDELAHEVIILCRSRERGEATIREIEAETGNTKTSIDVCDLSRLRDVRNAIEEIHARHDYLDALFVNAGLGYAARRLETEDGMDSHFQVNYLSQFMLTLNLLDLLENSGRGGRVVFNVTEGGRIFWDDIQMKKKWGYEDAIHQAMVARRMFCARAHDLYRTVEGSKVSFIGFQIPKAVWSNQINIIPFYMRAMATLMRAFGTFISIDECGSIMAPLFTEDQTESLEKSGKFVTWKAGEFTEIAEDDFVLDSELQDRLWRVSLELCNDEKTRRISSEHLGFTP